MPVIDLHWTELRLATFAASAGLVALCLLHYSRLLTIVLPPIATLGSAIILSGLAMIMLTWRDSRQGWLFVFLLGSLLMLLFGFQRFSNNAALNVDYRGIGAFSGIFLPFAFAAMVRSGGLNRTMRTIFALGVCYCIIYCAGSVVLQATGSLGAARRANLILYDPGRGDRLFANNTTIIFVLFYSLVGIVRRHRVPLHLAASGLALLAISFAQARMAMLAAVLVGILIVLRMDQWKVRPFLRVLPPTFIVLSIVLIANADLLVSILLAIDPDTLDLRADNLIIASELFSEQAILGYGLPSSPAFYEEVFRTPFFPEDLGGIGIISTLGLIGLAWVAIMIWLLCLGVERSFSVWTAVPLGYVGVYVALYSFVWPTIMLGDGSVFFSLAVAIYLYAERFRPDRMALRMTASDSHSFAMPLVAQRPAPGGAKMNRPARPWGHEKL